MQRRAPRVFCSGALRARGRGSAVTGVLLEGVSGALHAAVAVPFINRALENWGGLNWEDRFHHNDRSRAQRGGIGASLQRGVVMTRNEKLEGRDTASARRVLRRQASFEAAWPQLTTDCNRLSSCV